MRWEGLRAAPYVSARHEDLLRLGVVVPDGQRAELIVDDEHAVVAVWWLRRDGQVFLRCPELLRPVLTKRILREAGYLGFAQVAVGSDDLRTTAERRPEHTTHYCEENAARFVLAGGATALVFVSNKARACPFSYQRASLFERLPLLWDYHVLAAQPGQIYDLDSTLGFPVPIDTYLAATFEFLPRLPQEDRPHFRVLSKEQARLFSSDRRHMLATDGSYLAPIPPWPALGTGSNLQSLIDDEPGLGIVCRMGALADAIIRASSSSS